MSAKQLFIKHDPNQRGDDAGTIFHKASRKIDNKLVIYWEEADPAKHPATDVYVRHYRPDGDISHYVDLNTQLAMIDYRNFCKANRIQHTEIKNLAYITRAIQDYQRRLLMAGKAEKTKDLRHG